MSYTRYAGDRFAGPTGLPSSFPTDVADGAILVTSGTSSTDQALYVKVDGSWEQVVQTGVVLQNMTGHLLDQYSPQDIHSVKTFHSGAIFNDLVTINNLTVTGTQTILNTVDSTIKDNLILLNSGEAGAGITLQSGGIQIDRGSEADASILFDETLAGRDSLGNLYNEAFNFNFQVHVTGDRLIRESETGNFGVSTTPKFEYGVTAGVTSQITITGVTGVHMIEGINYPADRNNWLKRSQAVNFYVGGVLQTPDKYVLNNGSPAENDTVDTPPPLLSLRNSGTIFSGVQYSITYHTRVGA